MPAVRTWTTSKNGSGRRGSRSCLRSNGWNSTRFPSTAAATLVMRICWASAGGGVAVRGSAGPCEAKDLTSAMKRFSRSLKPELELAEKHQSYLAIENHGGRCWTRWIPSRHWSMNESPRLGIALAPYHMQASRRRSRRRLRCAVISCVLLRLGAGRRHGPIARPRPDRLRPWIAALVKIGFRGRQPVHARRVRARRDGEGPGPFVRVSEVLPQGLRIDAETRVAFRSAKERCFAERKATAAKFCFPHGAYPLYWVVPNRGPFGPQRRLAANNDGRSSVLGWGKTTRRGRPKTSAARSHSPRRGRGRFELLEPRRMLDSGVVFNEIMYHPTGDGATLEWVELHNQLAIDVDVFPLGDPRRNRL